MSRRKTNSFGDRLLMVLTGQGIRETIPFPLVKRLG